MTWDNIQGVLRAALAFGGGYLVSSGIIDNAMLTDAISALLMLGTIIWSITHKNQLKAA